MKVYTVLGVFDGVPSEVEVFASLPSARARGFELAAEYELLERPSQELESHWNPEEGSTRFWRHHWFDDQRDVVVAEAEVR